jgi:hypothetical protein
MIHYNAIRYYETEYEGLDTAEEEYGVCAPESMAAVALVHYPVNENWDIHFWVEDKE